jgi:RHS repeat-associated protein
VAHYAYDPFGHLLTTSPTPETARLFTGRPYDRVTGIMDYRLRQYDATLGRFLHRDPLNLMLPLQQPYAYVGNNPVNRIDPCGLWFDSLYEAVGTVTLVAAGAALATAAAATAVGTAITAASAAVTGAASTTAGLTVLTGGGAGAVINAAVTYGQRGTAPGGTTAMEVIGAAVVGGVVGGTGAGIGAGAGAAFTVTALTTAEATIGAQIVGGALGGVGALINEVNNQTHDEPLRPVAVALGAAGGAVLDGAGTGLSTTSAASGGPP